MVRNYIRKNTKTTEMYNGAILQQAVGEVKSGTTTVYRASKTYNIPYSTLYTNVKGTRGAISKRSGRPTCLSSTEETKLAEGLKTMEKWGFGLSRQEVLELVGKYVKSNGIKTTFKNDIPGEDWFLGFKKRNRLSIKVPQNVEYARKKALDPFSIHEYFNILEETIRNLNLQDKPGNIWNLDESSVSIDPQRTKVVGAVNQVSSRTISTPGKENTTILLMCNAAGGKAPPLIIYKGLHVWDQWMADTGQGYPGTVYAASKKGWMESEIFLNYFTNTILPTIGEDRPVLIIYDGHATHVTLPIIERAMRENVTIIKLPPHTSHLLQPLDLAVFKSFKTKWDQRLTQWQRQHVGIKLPKKIFSQFVGETWLHLPAQVIQNGFRKAGIVPLNKDVIPEDQFPPAALQRWKEHVVNTNNLNTLQPPDASDALVDPEGDTMACTSSAESAMPAEDSVVAGPSSSVLPHEDTSDVGSSSTAQDTGVIAGSLVAIVDSNSFENLLLSKIQQQPLPEKQTRKRICPGSEVLTSEQAVERMQRIKNDNKPKPKPRAKKGKTSKQKRKQISDSDSDLDEQIVAAYIDTDDDMDFEELLNENEDDDIVMKVNSWVLVQYTTKQTVKHFVGQVTENHEDGWLIKFTKFSNDQFVWPKTEDLDTVEDSDIVRVLPDPEVTRRGCFRFNISFDGFNLK